MTKEELKVKVDKQLSIINDANDEICSYVNDYIESLPYKDWKVSWCMKIRLAKKIMKKVYKTRYWAYRFGYYHGKKDSGKIAGDHRLIKAIKLTKK